VGGINMARASYLIKQRAFLKLYLIKLVEEGKYYGLEMRKLIQEEFKQYSFFPSHTEIYDALHDLVRDGILYQERAPYKDAEFQKVFIYKFTADGMEKAKIYKKQVYIDLDRSIKLLKKAMKDNY
jgi:DNA-binding PadR family transcriptional regulator